MAKPWGAVRGVLSRIVRAGVGPEVATRVRKQLVVTNLFALMSGLITGFWLVLYELFWETVLPELMLAIIVTSAIVPYLNHRGHTVASRLLLLFVSTSSGAVFALALGPESGIMIMFLPMTCAPLVLFDFKERALVAVALPFPIMLAVGVEWYQIDHGPMLENAPALAIEHSQHVSLITATIMVATMMSFMYSVHASSEAKLEQRYRELIRQGKDVVLSLDEQGHIVDSNREAERVLGYTRHELVGMPIGQIDAALLGARYEHLVDGLRRGGPRTLRHRYMRKDGSEYPVELRIGLIREGGEQVLAAAHDASERSELEARLRLADRMVSVGTLAAGVAHEVNNPLTYIALNLNRVYRRVADLGDSMQPDQQQEMLDALQMALDGSKKVSTIVSDLKTFSSSRGSSDVLGPVDVEHVLDATLKLAYHDVTRSARVTKSFVGVPHVRGNEARLGQVFLNVLLNASQAMRSGAEDNELRLRTSHELDGRIAVEITDTGEGIRHEDLPRIFDPFFTTKQDNSGTGLGLYVCRLIIEECGGDLVVSSQVGQGTTLRVLLQAAHREEGRLSGSLARELVKYAG